MGGIIRPLGVAEIGRAAGEGVGCHRRPNRMGQVRAGFQHDDEVAGPGDGEPKPIRPHTEVGAAGLRLRVPQHGRNTFVISGTPKGVKAGPARDPRQVIDGRRVIILERTRANAGGVTPEVNSSQASAVGERLVPDAGDWIAIDHAGDGYRTAGTAVSGDGDRAAIGRESELGLHRSGQRRQQQERQQHFETRLHTTF